MAIKEYLKFLKESLPYVFIIGFAFFMFRGIFATGFMSGYDNSFHYYDAYYLTNTLIPHYHWISGWSMQGMAGFPVFVDYYQIGFWAITILNKILFLPLNLSYKLMVFVSYIILGAGFYKLVSNRFGKIAALLVTICLMLQKDIYYDRILGGMWNNYLAIGLFFIFFHMLDKYINALTVKRSVILGLLAGLIILTHIYAAIFAFVLLFLYMFHYFSDAIKKKIFVKQLFICIWIPITAVMISSYYLFGFIIAKDYFVKLGTKPLAEGIIWGAKSFFGPLETVNSLSAFMINVPIIVRIIFSFFGIYLFFRKEKNSDVRRFLWCLFWFIVVAFVLFIDVLPQIFKWWHSIPLIATLQISRLLIYIQIGMYIFAAYGLAKFLEFFRKKRFVITMCLVPILFSAFFHYANFARDGSRTLEQSPQMVNVYRVWNWVNKNIRPGEGRIVYQNTVGNIGDPILARSDVFALSGIVTKVAQIGVSRSASPFPQEQYMRNDRGRIFGELVNEVSDAFIRDRMDSFNAGHIVTVEPELKNMLNKSSLFFKEKDFGSFSVFRLKGFKSEWVIFEKKAVYKNFELENQRVKFNIDNESGQNEVSIKVAYHPFWRARLNEKSIDLKKEEYGLIGLSLPDNGYYQLELSFNSFNPVWVSVSFLSFIISLFIIARHRDRHV